jgi:Domain of unknown function (DUF4167)
LKRSRRGGRRPQHTGGGGSSHNANNNNNNGGGGHNPNRTFDSSGPEVKIRGSASNVYEKYLQLARDANANGDRVMAESYLQHAEHYYRIMAAQAQAQQQYQQQQALQQQNNNNNGQNRPQNGQADAQPYAGQQPNTSAPSFSLNEGEEEGEEETAE